MDNYSWSTASHYSVGLLREMPPFPQPTVPRIVIYHQTHHTPGGVPVSILPLITHPDIRITHLIVAAIHLHDPPGREHLRLNDHVPHDACFLTLWAEVKALQVAGVKVMGMLGGAAKGSFARLDLDEATFEMYYVPLRDLIRERSLDGLDLDIEEPMTLAGVIRLIDRLKADFGEAFIVTLAPVAAALMTDGLIENYAEFSYEALEVMRGRSIAWYNAQFYCGWGDMSNTASYDMIMTRGFPPQKLVIGLVSNPANGPGWVPFEVLQEVFITLRSRYGVLGGVMSWEYFNSLPGDRARPWEWALWMTRNTRGEETTSQVPLHSRPRIEEPAQRVMAPNQQKKEAFIVDIQSEEAQLPEAFDYLTDGNAED